MYVCIIVPKGMSIRAFEGPSTVPDGVFLVLTYDFVTNDDT